MQSFDRLDRSLFVKFLEHRIGNRRAILLISGWLGVGVMNAGHGQAREWVFAAGSTVQGRHAASGGKRGTCSPGTGHSRCGLISKESAAWAYSNCFGVGAEISIA